MIITKLYGGLGNQMFQYAAGRRLSYTLGVKLKLDISAFPDKNQRTYALKPFCIEQSIASSHEIAKFKNNKRTIIDRIFTPPFKPFPKYINEKYYHFDSNILSLKDNIYLDGYWQSECYFEDITDLICNDFSIKNPMYGKNKDLSNLIESCKSVSVHIRRGDYITNPKAHKFHGICDLDYYKYCAVSISQKIKTPHFFIFSDEPDWAHKNVKLNAPVTIVDHNDTNHGYKDLKLMSLCKHQIIANSSFSWWGAWLNPHKDKIVYAPKKWFNYYKHDTKNLIPSSWTTV